MRGKGERRHWACESGFPIPKHTVNTRPKARRQHRSRHRRSSFTNCRRSERHPAPPATPRRKAAQQHPLPGSGETRRGLRGLTPALRRQSGSRAGQARPQLLPASVCGMGNFGVESSWAPRVAQSFGARLLPPRSCCRTLCLVCARCRGHRSGREGRGTETVHHRETSRAPGASPAGCTHWEGEKRARAGLCLTLPACTALRQGCRGKEGHRLMSSFLVQPSPPPQRTLGAKARWAPCSRKSGSRSILWVQAKSW